MAFDAFLKIDDVEGDSDDRNHKGEIDVHSFSWGESQAATGGTGGGGGSGRVSFQDFQFTMSVNKASPVLMAACATGKHFKEAKLTCRKAGGGGVEFLTIKMNDILVSSYQTAGSAGDDIPADEIALNFAKIEVAFSDTKGNASR
jgi:type VI secretion system secreted protein Hcp